MARKTGQQRAAAAKARAAPGRLRSRSAAGTRRRRRRPGDLVLEELTREKILDWRNRAAADHQLVIDHIDQYGELSAQRLTTPQGRRRCRRRSRPVQHLPVLARRTS
ncbi:hypothetical protein CUT44_13050 [Streptomyces carminius]|uniref:Uncharacterized protein n=1 Tax=Streptomyces carminius TaxID=2665496 RepID=A0A2M8LZB6_9ACTN|nr:hypothetical protein [Streptomyces carminius]PJE97303.1 hypothetical protein CUT44_13050 [Streptomyces carminius]